MWMMPPERFLRGSMSTRGPSLPWTASSAISGATESPSGVYLDRHTTRTVHGQADYDCKTFLFIPVAFSTALPNDLKAVFSLEAEYRDTWEIPAIFRSMSS